MIDNDPDRQLTLEEAEAEIAKRYGIPDAVWKPMVQQESGGRTDAVSPKGARGRWQVMPATAKALGIDINDDLQVAEGGLRYLRDNYKRLRKYAKNEKHAWMAAVAAYHAGPGAVEKDFKRGGVGLPETSDGRITTRNHVLKIFDGIPSTAFDRSPLGNVGQAAITGQPQSVPPAAAPFSLPQQTGEMPKRMEMPVNPETGNYSTPEQMEIYNQVFPNQPAPRLSQARIGQQLQGAAKELLTGQPEQPAGQGLQPMFPEPPQPQPGQAGQGGPLQLEGGFTTDPDQAHVPQGGVRVTKDGKSYLATPQGNGQFSLMAETPETSYREYLKAVGMPDGPEAMQAFKDAQAALKQLESTKTPDEIAYEQKVKQYNQDVQSYNGQIVTQQGMEGRKAGSSRQLGRQTFGEDLNRVAGWVEYDPSRSRKQNFIDAVSNIAARYNITPAEVKRYADTAYSSDEKFFRGDLRPGDRINVTFDVLAAIGGDKVVSAIREEEARNKAVSGIGVDLSTDRDWARADAEWLNSNAGKALVAVNPLFAFLSEDQRNNIGASLAGGFIGSGSRTWRALAGVARPINTDLYEYMQKIAGPGERLEGQTGDGGIVSTLAKVAGGAPGDLSRLYLLTRLPSRLVGPGTGAVVGMSAEMALQSSGRGDTPGTVAKEAAKGGTLGAVFAAAPLIGRLVGEYPIAGVTQSAKALSAGREVGTLAAVGLGSGLVETAFGSSDEQALQTAVLNSLFHLVTRGINLRGRTVRGRDADGNQVKVGVDQDLGVRLLKGRVGKPDVEVHVNNTAPRPPQPGQPSNRGLRLGEGPPARIETPVPAAVQKAQTNPRVRKVADFLQGKEFTNIDEIVKATRLSKANAEDAIMTLYGAGLVEMLPGNRVRLVDSEKYAQESDLFERAKTYGEGPPPAQGSTSVGPAAPPQPPAASGTGGTTVATRPEPITPQDAQRLGLNVDPAAPIQKFQDGDSSVYFEETPDGIRVVGVEQGGQTGAAAGPPSGTLVQQVQNYAGARPIEWGSLADADEPQPTQTAQPTVGQPVSPGQQTVTSERPTEPTEPSGLSPYTESQIRRDQFTHPQYNIRQLAEEMGITPDAVRAALPDIDKLTPEDFARKYNVPVEAVNKLRPLGEIGYDGYMAHRVRATTLDPNNEGMFNELSDIFANGDLRFRDADFQTKGGIADALMDQIAASVGKPRASQMTRGDWESVLNTHADRMNINTVKAIVAALDEHAEWVKAVDAFLADPELAQVIADVFDEFGVSTWRDLTEISVVANLEKKGLPVTPEAFSRAGLSSGGPTAKLRKEILRIGRKYATKLNDAGNPILTDDAIRRAYDRAVYARTGGSPQGRTIDGPGPRVPGGSPSSAPEPAAVGRRSAVDTEAAVNMPARRGAPIQTQGASVSARMPDVSKKTENVDTSRTDVDTIDAPAEPVTKKPVAKKPAAKKEAKTPDLPEMTPAQQAEREVYPKTGREQREIIDTIRENAPLEGKFYAMEIEERKAFMATLPPKATRGEIANAFDEWRKSRKALPKQRRPENDLRDEIGDAGDDILASASAVDGDEAQREQEIAVMAANRSALIPFTTPIVRELSKIKGGKVKRQTLEQMINRPGIKGPEKKLLQSILARFDDYEMSASDIELAAALEVTPLSVITEHSAYDSYGMSTVGLPSSKSKTLVFNTPYDYGYTGHFTGEFGARDSQSPPSWIPRATQDESGRTVWIALDEANFPQDRAVLTEENAGQYIGVVADDLATVEGWIASQGTGAASRTTELNRGLFGHGRAVDMDDGKTVIYVEIQTDTLQKNSPADLFAKHYEQMADRGSRIDPVIMHALEVYRKEVAAWRSVKQSSRFDLQATERQAENARDALRLWRETAPAIADRLEAKFGPDASFFTQTHVTELLQEDIDAGGALPLAEPGSVLFQSIYHGGTWAGLRRDVAWVTATVIDPQMVTAEGYRRTIREQVKVWAGHLQTAEEILKKIADLPQAKLRADRAAAAFIESLPLRDQLFAGYAKSARVRLLREVIRREALAGKEKFRLATEWTLAAVEGYSAVARATRPRTASGELETGEGPFGMPYEPGLSEAHIDENTTLDVGDTIEYNGDTYEVIRSEDGTFEAVDRDEMYYDDWGDWQQNEREYVEEQIGSGLERAIFRIDRVATGFAKAADVATALMNVPYINVDVSDLIDAIEHDLASDEFVVPEMIERLRTELKEADDDTDEAQDIETEIERLEGAVKDFKDRTFNDVLNKLLLESDVNSSLTVHHGEHGRFLQTLTIEGEASTGYQGAMEIRVVRHRQPHSATVSISALTRSHLLERAAKEATDFMMENGHADDLIDWRQVDTGGLATRLAEGISFDYSNFFDDINSRSQWIEEDDYSYGIRWVSDGTNTISFDQPGTYFERYQEEQEAQAEQARLAEEGEADTPDAPEGWTEVGPNVRDYRQISDEEWARMTDSAGVKTPAGTVLKKHGELLKDFKKERPDWRVWTDPVSGYQYLETDLTPDDKGDILAFNKEQADIRAEANRVRSMLRDLRDTQKWSLKALAAIATSRVVDGILDGNAATTEIVRRAILNAYGRDVGLLYGIYVAPRSAMTVWTALKDLANSTPDIATATAIRRVAADWGAAMDRTVGDIIFAPTLPRSGTLREQTLSEELAHRADYRSRGFRTIHDTSGFGGLESYKKAAAEVRRNYPTVPDHIVHAEVVAKSFRTDAMDELGLTADEVVELRHAYADQLLDAGITAQAILENFRDVKTAEELTNQIRQRRDREKSGLANARGPDGRFVPSGAGQGTQQPAGRTTEGQKEKEDAVAPPDDASILRQAEADDILLSRPKMTDVEDVEAIKKDIDFNAKQLMSYIYDGKRDVRWPEAVVNLVRSGYLAGYSVIGTNVAWNTANLAMEEMVKAFALPVDWTRRQVAKRLDEGKTEELLKAVDKRLAEAKKDLAELEKDKKVNGEAIKAQGKVIESIQAERRRIRARRGPNATKRAVAGTRPGDVIAGLFGETGAFREGLGYGPRGLMGALKEGIPAEEAKKFDFAGEEASDQSFVRNTGSPLIDAIIEATKRISMGVDRPFKAYARTSGQRATARAMARDMVDAGVTKDWKEMADRLIMDPNEAMIDLAERYAQIVTFQNPNPITDAVDSIKASLLSNQILEKIAPKLATHAGAKVGTSMAYVGAGMTVPFVRTPSNIGIRALEHTPFGIVSAAWHFHKVGNGYERMLHEIEKKQIRADEDARIKKLKDDELAATKKTLNKLAMQYAQKKAELDERIRLAGKNEDLVKRNKDAFKRWSQGFKAAKEKAKAEQEQAEAALRAQWKKEGQILEDARRIADDADDMRFSMLEWNRMASAFGRFGAGTVIGGLILLGVYYGIIDAVGRIGWDDEDQDEAKRKEEMRKAGINDFTVQIGGRRYQYDRFPLGQALGMGVNVLEQMQRPGTNNQRFFAAGDKFLTDVFNSNPVTDARFEQTDRWSKAGSYAKSLTPIVNMKIWQEIGNVADEKPRTSFNKGFVAQFGRQMPVPALRDAFGVPESKMPLGGRRKTLGERLLFEVDPSKSMPATRSGRSMPVIPLKDPGEKARPKVRW